MGGGGENILLSYMIINTTRRSAWEGLEEVSAEPGQNLKPL
jgi:hypothetical protein